MTFTSAYRLLSLSIQLSVHMTRHPLGGARRVVSSISEINGWEDNLAVTTTIFELGPDGYAIPTGATLLPKKAELLEAAGFNLRWLQPGARP